MHNVTFLTLTGLGIVIVILFIVFASRLAKNFKAVDRKRFLLFLITPAICAGAFLGISYLIGYFPMFWLFCLTALAAGCIQFATTHKKFMAQDDERKYKVVTGEILFTIATMIITCIVFSLLQYYLKNKQFLFYPMLLAVLAYIWPSLFCYTFDSAIRLPATDFHVWEYPSVYIDPPGVGSNDNPLVLRFLVSGRPLEKKSIFRVRVPENLTLGEFFYHFINECNGKRDEVHIEYVDEYNDPIVWWFRVQRKWYNFNRVLNPYDRVRDNNIKENSVVVCEQLTQKLPRPRRK